MGCLSLAPCVGVPQLDRGVDVEHAVVVAPLQDLAAVDVPGQVDQQVAGGDVLASSEPRFSGVTRSLTNVMPCSSQGAVPPRWARSP